MEGLKNNLKEQDKRIENLKEKVNILEAQVRKESVMYFNVNVSMCVCMKTVLAVCATVPKRPKVKRGESKQ